jgi:hypothetical protein
VSAYVRFYSLMVLMIGAAFAIARGLDAVWPGRNDSFIPDVVAGAVVLTPLILLRRKRPDLPWLYPDAPEEWATTRPTTAAAIFALLVALLSFVGGVATGFAVVGDLEVAAFMSVVTFVVVLLMECIARLRQRGRPRGAR